MDPVRNPYNPGAGSRPAALVGRDQELGAVDVAIRRLAQGRPAKSQMLTGLRGVGKTVLLGEFGRIAQGHGWIHEHVEATEDLDFAHAMASMARRALLRLRARERAKDRAVRALGVLRAFRIRWHLPDGPDLEVDIDPVAGRADSGLLDEDLGALFSEVGSAARTDEIGVLLTIDEVQYLDRDQLSALIVALHRMAQEELPFMVCGAGLPSLPGLAGEAKSYAERLFDFPTIGSLDAEDSARALRDPAAAEGVAWDAGALAAVEGWARGYPYFLQEFGKQAWDVAVGPDRITVEDVALSVPLAREELDAGFFRARLDRVSDADRQYLRAMASLGEGPYGSAAVAAALGRSVTQVGPTRDRLIKRGICYSPRWGEIAFTVPMFDEFVRRTLGDLGVAG